MTDQPLKIAMLGTRGVPASYSGFETCVEQLGARLVERGHRVTVYCRRHHIEHAEPTYRGMKLVKLPSIKSKHFDTLSHSLLSSLHMLPGRYDAGLYFIAGNSPVTWIPRLFGVPTALNVDGLDWKRQKWGGLAKRYIQFAEWLAQYAPTLYLTDSPLVQAYYQNKTGKAPPYIVYGSDIERLPPGETLAEHGVEAMKYLLFVGRLVPENNAHHLVRAVRMLIEKNVLPEGFKCVIVGDAPFAEDYKKSLHETAEGDDRVIFTGYVFGNGYQEFGSNAYANIATTGVGGTHPALIEAMAMGNCCVVNDTPVNVQTISGDTDAPDGTVGLNGLTYAGHDADGEPLSDEDASANLATVLGELLNDPERAAHLRERAGRHAANAYSWEKVTDEYEKLCYELAHRPVPIRLRDTPSKVPPRATRQGLVPA